MFSASVVGSSSPARPVVFVMIGAAAAAVVAAVILAAVSLWSPVHALSAPFAPSEASGHIEDAASLADAELPAIALLDPALLSAMRDAATAAGADGVAFEVTSGWRSRAYQQWLLDDAIVEYGSEEIARQFVATPDRSRHVTGHAIDIGGLDAQSWLIQHGAQWGICQIYANERWHFELATEPGGVCPDLLPDAGG
ncbi:M15 family metallopeptidase [Microbacterium sp. DT81.1]|uniref:M15 family metallopeptidase n=1 Tax=Microbacterium sp. DT81.1 TaxID=3393413 RepID=UPI003CEB3482